MTRRHFLTATMVGLIGRRAPLHAQPRPAMREYDVLRRFPAGRLVFEAPDAQGLMGTNKVHGMWIEAGPQRGSCRSVIYAVVQDNLPAADQAWRGIEVAFSHQLEDGRFEANLRPNGQSAKPYGAAVETAFFFMQEYMRAVLVIRQSPHAAHFAARIAALQPKARRAMDFISGGVETIMRETSHAPNRIIIGAKALGLGGLVLDDPALVQQARTLMAHALTLRDADGVFVEKGGRDSSYNMVSVLFGQVLTLHVPMPEAEAAFAGAMAWQISRVLPSGEVDVRNNSRTGVGKEVSYGGAPKTVNYTEMLQALTLYGLVHQDAAALAAADRVQAYMQRQ
ncbi:hypothetical protein [Luteitalea sp.]|uniref:hypothetical protein n=1 Tax=Luteitalea sp. TaxID=2004800 RepID=UPI0025BD263E|nr:hypothetical protein [Luteitalea sp.]